MIDYNKKRAIDELKEFCGFQYYEAKHLENSLTKVIQLRWFFEKFKVDKRRSHLSSLIVSGQMTRDEALEEMKKPLYDEKKMETDVQTVLAKLNMSRDEFEKLIGRSGKQHTDYPTDKAYIWFNRFFRLPFKLMQVFRK